MKGVLRMIVLFVVFGGLAFFVVGAGIQEAAEPPQAASIPPVVVILGFVCAASVVLWLFMNTREE